MPTIPCECVGTASIMALDARNKIRLDGSSKKFGDQKTNPREYLVHIGP